MSLFCNPSTPLFISGMTGKSQKAEIKKEKIASSEILISSDFLIFMIPAMARARKIMNKKIEKERAKATLPKPEEPKKTARTKRTPYNFFSVVTNLMKSQARTGIKM